MKIVEASSGHPWICTIAYLDGEKSSVRVIAPSVDGLRPLSVPKADLPSRSFRSLSALLWSEDNGRIPLFDGEKHEKTAIQALRGPNAALQAVDSIRVHIRFPYAAEQRKFGGQSGELNGRTAELQRYLSVRSMISPVAGGLAGPCPAVTVPP
jgi:hypothetical protein